jgi:dihydrofolate synthase/folylpolyglutamate synthase
VVLERAADKVFHADSPSSSSSNSNSSSNSSYGLTFFEALTAVAFLVYAEAKVDYAVLETGLGGRLDATNVCRPELCVITKIGLDHCDWLGDTVEKIAAEKAGIIKKGVPIVLGKNDPAVVAVVKARASEVGAPFVYAPDVADESEIPDGFSLVGSFNRENAVTAIAALKTLGLTKGMADGLGNVVWPGRFQRVGRFIIDGAHNPPAARALAAALRKYAPFAGSVPTLVAGFCGDKDVDETLRILAPLVKKGIAVRTNNPRSLDPVELARKMESAGISAISCDSVQLALEKLGSVPKITGSVPKCEAVDVLICGSLFLAGEALAALGAFPWQTDRFDAAEILKV